MMGEELGDGQIGRRDLLKKGAVAGGLVWASPMIFSATAGAQVVGACTDCPDDRLYGIKYNNGSGLEELPASGRGSGNCLTASAEFPAACLDELSLFEFDEENSTDSSHIWYLAPSLQFCQAAGKVGGGTVEEGDDDCFSCPGGTSATCGAGGETRITVETVGDRLKITIADPALSHSEILFCYRGSPLACLDED